MSSRYRNFDFTMKPFDSGPTAATPNGMPLQTPTTPQSPDGKKKVRIQEFPYLPPASK